MQINFPNSPALNSYYTFGTKTWQWDGVAWNVEGHSSAEVAEMATLTTMTQQAKSAADLSAFTAFRDAVMVFTQTDISPCFPYLDLSVQLSRY